MSISFSQYDETNRVRGAYMEIDNTRAIRGLVGVQRKVLIIGSRLSSGTVAVETPVLSAKLSDARSQHGVGSQLADMYKYWEANNTKTETWTLSVGDGSVASTKLVSISASAVEAGTLFSYIGGTRATTTVSAGATPTEIATALALTVNNDTNNIFSASSAVGVVTLTAKNKGEWTEALNVSFNYRSPNYGGSEVFPVGVTVAIDDGVTGSSNPDIASALASIPDERFDCIIMPYTDDANMDLFDSELATRQDAMTQLEGHGFNARGGSVGSLTTYGNDRNSPHNTTMDAGLNMFTPEHGWASAYAGQATFSIVNDVARPWQTLVLSGVLSDHPEDLRIRSERNTLLYDGVATHDVNASGAVFIERGITNYQTNTAGQPDASYLDSQTAFTASYCRITFNSWMLAKFPRYKLASDDAVLSSGQAVVTPKVIEAEAIAWFQALLEEAIVENMTQFKTDIFVEIDATDPNRVNVLLPPDFVNQFRVIASVLQFRL